MTNMIQKPREMDTFVLNSGRRVKSDWQWVVSRKCYDEPWPEFPYGFQDETEKIDIDVTDDERREIAAWIMENISYEPPDVY